MRHAGMVIVGVIAVCVTACVSFRPFSARIEDEVQSLYRGMEALEPEANYLVIALDGVPYHLIAAVKREGYFPSFGEPSELISTFPSSTIPGFTGLFRPIGCDIPKGYENKFFSLSENRYRGDTWKDYRRILIPFRLFFNYYRHSIFNKATMYAFPARTVRRDLAKIERHVGTNGGNRLDMVYIGGTDGAAHVLGYRRTALLLKTISRHLEALRTDYRRRHGKELHIALFSDHGFHFSNVQSVSLAAVKAELRKKGLRLRRHLKEEGDVVAVLFGNLSSAVFYTAEDRAEMTAHALSRVEGIDLAFYKAAPSAIGMYSRRGDSAMIDIEKEAKRLCYRPIRGDPLDYRTLFPKTTEASDAGFCLSKEEWWERSKDHYYPHALGRLYDAFNTLVENQAQVIVSTIPPFELGSSAARIGNHMHGGLEGTHGGLFRSASSAFAMSTMKKAVLPRILSYDDLFPRWTFITRNAQ